MAAFTSRVDEMYSQYEAGLIEGELWSQYREVMAGFLANSAVKEWWDSGAAVFSTNFRKEIDTTAPDQRWDAESLRVLRTAGPRE